MFIKIVLLFCSHVLLINTVFSQIDSDVHISKMTEQQYNGLQGPDFCGALKNNIDTLKDACTKVAVREGLIQPGGTVPFKAGYPKCELAKIQFYDAQGNKAKTIDTDLVGCANDAQSFPIGKGQAANDIMMYGCPNAVCEPYYNMPGAF